MEQSKPITVAVVGLGRIGWLHHVPGLTKNPAFKIVAACDLLEDRRKEAADLTGCQTFASAAKLFKAAPAELAIICTRSVDHAPHALAALKAGMHVLVEKPMSMNVRQADRMIAAAKAAGRLLTVHQSARDRADARFVRQTIESGILGEVFWIRYSMQSFFRRNDWQQLKKYGGGFLNNNGIHAIDSALHLLGSPVADVWGDLKHKVASGDADDWLKVVLRGANGRVFEVEQSYACAIPQPTWLVCGTTGTMQIVKDQAEIKFFDPTQVSPLAVIDGAPIPRRYGNDDRLPWQTKTVPATPTDAGPDFYDNLAEAIRSGGELLITPESVREDIRVLDAVRKGSMWKA